MIIKYSIKDKNDKSLMSDTTAAFIMDVEFRAYIKREMKRMKDAHYCEYMEIGYRGRHRTYTIANF